MRAHGTLARYKAGCHCNRCRAANARQIRFLRWKWKAEEAAAAARGPQPIERRQRGARRQVPHINRPGQHNKHAFPMNYEPVMGFDEIAARLGTSRQVVWTILRERPREDPPRAAQIPQPLRRVLCARGIRPRRGIPRSRGRRMSDPLCRDCFEQNGAQVKATRILRSGPRCDMHWRKIAGMPPASSIQEEVKEMAKGVFRSDVDWDEVRAQKALGASAKELAEKFGVHVSSIYLHTKSNGVKPAGGANRDESRKLVAAGARRF